MRGPCAVYTCKNRGVHLFPKKEPYRKLWIKALRLDERRRVGWHINTNSGVCSEHFLEDDFIIVPPLLDGDQERRRLKKNCIPSIFPWSKVTASQNPSSDKDSDFNVLFNPSGSTKDYTRKEPPLAYVEQSPFLSQTVDLENDPLQIIRDEEHVEEHIKDNVLSSTVHLEDDYISLETVISMENEEQNTVSAVDNSLNLKTSNLQPSSTDIGIQTDDTPFSVHTYKHNKKIIHFYTGLESFEKLTLVFQSLGESDNLQYLYGPPPKKIIQFEQFFITLIILRQHKTFEELSMMYIVPIKQIANMFITWIRFMAKQWRKLDLWIDKSTVIKYMPIDFYEKYPATRVIIDATECPVKKPGLPRAQQITFSSYKNRNTVKTLIGISPTGLITYVSPCYGGSATDRQIIERSHILQRFQYNDEVMVDKGLNVQDIFAPYGVKINMPAFFRKGNQIGSETLRENRKVASKRVHVERVIGLMKTYKILTQPMNRTETLLSSDIVFVCAMLTNFRSSIVDKTA